MKRSAAEIILEYGPFPGVDRVGGVTYDGQRVWIAAGDRLNAVDPESGKLSAMGHVSCGGKTPRNFAIDPTGKWLLAANQNSNNICVFRIDPSSGKLEATGEEIKVSHPVCVKFYTPGK